MKLRLIMILSIFFLCMNIVYAKEEVKFEKCVDGDTFKVLLDNKEYTIRMLAIDTPESVHPTKGLEYYGKEASEYTCEMVTNAKKIEIEYDENSEKVDKYDRLLGWIFVDKKLLQELLVENGYAKIAYLYDDYKYTDRLEEKQELASINNIGIWDMEAANNFSGNVMDTNIDKEKQEYYSIMDIIIIVALLLIIVFVGDKTIKSKAKKNLKKYLK